MAIIETTLTYKSEHVTQVDTNFQEFILYYFYIYVIIEMAIEIN
jgi:hypothetical protein